MRIHQNQKTKSLISTNLKILSNLTQNLNLIDMRKNGHFFNQKWTSVSKVCGVVLIAKSVSLLWWGTDFHLWKSFQSRLRLNDWETHWTPLITLFRKYVARRKKTNIVFTVFEQRFAFESLSFIWKKSDCHQTLLIKPVGKDLERRVNTTNLCCAHCLRVKFRSWKFHASFQSKWLVN